MLVFIDESGIHKQEDQSTTALVYVKVEHVDRLNRAILNAEKNLKIGPFHWRDQSWKIREAFLKSILKEEFEVKIFIFANPYTNEKLETALKHLLVEEDVRNIIIDGKKSRGYARHFKKVLREAGIPVKKIRFGNDRGFPCLRLADLFAGLVRSYADNPDKKEAENAYNLAKIKITIRITDGQVPASPF